MTLWKIVAGLGVGAVVGVLNVVILRLVARKTLCSKHRTQSAGLVAVSYLMRYLIIGAVVLTLVKMGETGMALIVLAVLGALIIILTIYQRGR